MRVVSLFLAIIWASQCWAAPRHIVSEGTGVYPPGFSIFCLEHPTECEPVDLVETVKFAEWHQILTQVNREVNEAITYQEEMEDRWTIGPESGDCDDYTVTKRARLVDAGLPRGAMSAAYVLLPSGESHVFLVVSTDAGEMVLSNGYDDISELERHILSRLSLQDRSNPRIWNQIY